MANTNPKKVTLGLIQMSCEEDVRKNLDQALTRAAEAASQGAQIICLQELFTSRYFCQVNDKKFFKLARQIPNSDTEALASLARDKQVVLVASLFEKDGAEYFNTACVFDADGAFLGKYRKVHVPDDLQNHYSEKFYFTPGNLGFKPFQTRYAKIGVQVCWDQWFPEGARSLALQGAEILFYPTAIGWPEGGAAGLGEAEYDAWVTVQRGHAISNTVFLAAANRTGREDYIDFWGGSFVCDPFGKILQQASHREEKNLIVECDLGRIQEVRRDWPFLSCRRSETYLHETTAAKTGK
jgi:N-carbamoylputrescine amidase